MSIDYKREVDLPMSVINFLDYCRTDKGLLGNTIAAYKSDLYIFFTYLKESKKKKTINNNFIKGIKLDDINKFMVYLEKEKKCSDYARRRKVSALKAYFDYLKYKVKLIKDNPLTEIENPKLPKRNPIVLTLEQCKQLLNSLDEWSAYYFRDKCILTIFLNCGLRLSELCNIKISDIKDNRITVFGKGSKDRYVFLNEACIKTINEYLAERKDENASEEDKQYLFLSDRQKKIAKTTVQTLVKKYLNKAGLKDQDYSASSLRHSFATIMYQNGNDLKVIQELLGHSFLSTTEVYGYSSDEDNDMLIKAFYKNPLNKL